MLFQRRSRTTDTWPGALDVAVGGHVRAGETLTETVREAEEEIGLVVGLPDLVRLGRRFAQSASGCDREVQEVFGVRSDLPLDAYRLHAKEVESAVIVPLDAALAVFAGEIGAVAGLELARGAGVATAVPVEVASFAGADTNDYARLALEGLRDVIAGATPEPFLLRE